jgi:hypothetical protein
LLEAPPSEVVLPIGGGVVVTLVKTTGPWCIVKYVPSEKGFPYAKPISAGTAETLGGLTLASTIVRWWLLLGAERPTAAMPAPSPSADDAAADTAATFDGGNNVQYNGDGEQAPADKAGRSEDPIGFVAGDANLHRYGGNSPTEATDRNGFAAYGTFDIRMVPQAGPATGNPLDAVTAVKIIWKPPADVDKCECARVGFFQIAQTYQRTEGIWWGENERFKDWHFDNVRWHAEVVDYVKGSTIWAQLKDDPGAHSPRLRKRLLELHQTFETGVVCLDRQSPRYLDVFGTVRWYHYYVRTDTTSTFSVGLFATTGTDSCFVSGTQHNIMLSIKDDVGKQPSGWFMSYVGGRLGKRLKW